AEDHRAVAAHQLGERGLVPVSEEGVEQVAVGGTALTRPRGGAEMKDQVVQLAGRHESLRGRRGRARTPIARKGCGAYRFFLTDRRGRTLPAVSVDTSIRRYRSNPTPPTQSSLPPFPDPYCFTFSRKILP